jgi:hypothetical protein
MGIDPLEKIKVFISSVQNRKIENLEADRAEAVRAVQNYSPTAPWAFEYTPASDLPAEDYYLRGVQDCHLFLLLLGGQITEAVRKEYDEAVRLKKPVLAFVKDAQRTTETEQFLNLVRKQSKYTIFNGPQDLAALVVSSLDSFFLRLVEDYQLHKEYPDVIKVLANTRLAKLLHEYAEQLLTQTSASFEAEVIHYLTLIPMSLRDVSRFYIPMKAKIAGGASDTIDNILAKHKRVVFLGAAGSGKTTELLNFSTRLSRHAIEETESRLIPVYVDMGAWMEGDIISCLESIFQKCGIHFGKPMVEGLLKNYRFVLLFDGLNEVPPLELLEKVSQIKSISKTYEGVEIIVSCRTVGYVLDLGFPVVHLEPLQDADIVKYMGEFTKGEFNLGRFYSWPSSLRELSRHPLMLSFIANIFAEGAEPTSLADVYEKYINLLFDRWEVGKGAKIDPVWKKRALIDLAVDMQTKPRYSVSENEAINLLRGVMFGERVDFSSVDLLNELVSSGMIKKEGNRYTFWHSSFREYLAGQLLIDKIRVGETISTLVSDPVWEPVVIFASGLFDDSFEMSGFLFEVLKVDLYLYTRCLANVLPAITSVPALSDDELAHLILQEMLEARAQIIDRWLPALLHAFRPHTYHGKGSQLAIVGRFSSEGGGYLAYGYATTEKLGSRIRLLGDYPAGTILNTLLNAGILSSTISRGLPLNEAGVVGAHRIALEDIWEELKEIIRAKSLLEPPRLIYELTQGEVCHLVRDRVLSVPIPADISLIETEVSKLLRGYGTSQVILRVGGENIHLNALLLRLKALADSGYTSIGAPLLPKPDRIPKGSNWVTQFYEDQTLVDYVRLYFYHFLEGYSELVKLNFSQLSQRLEFHQLLPVRVVAEIERPAPSKDLESLGGCDYYFEPVEGTRQNEVVVSLNQKVSEFLSPSSNLQDAMETWLEKLKRYGRWNSTATVWTTRASLGTFFGERNQIRSALYDSILKGLKKVFEVRAFRL